MDGLVALALSWSPLSAADGRHRQQSQQSSCTWLLSVDMAFQRLHQPSWLAWTVNMASLPSLASTEVMCSSDKYRDT